MCVAARPSSAGTKASRHAGFRERDRLGFTFMSNDVSSERRVEGSVARIAAMMRDVKQGGGRIAVSPARSRAHRRRRALRELIRHGFVDVVLAGNALAVHDVEFALRALARHRLVAGAPVEQGHRNHMAAINTINRAGSLRRPSSRRAQVRGDVRMRHTWRRVRPRREHPR
jgi:hypothetical protein